MHVREAKDSPVNQTTERAAIDSVPFSYIEKRMMYFNESDYICQDPIALNGELETQYDRTDYNKKVTRLMTQPS